MQDYRVKITIRNERLLAAMEGLGYKSVAEFSRNQGLNSNKVREIFSGKIPPLDKDGRPKDLTKEILELLDLTIEKAFTEKQLKGFKKHTFEIKLEEEKLLQITNPAKNLEVKVIEQDVKNKFSEIFSKYLTPREENVLRMRYGIGLDTDHTLEEVGLKFSVNRERIRQIEAKAIRKLKHPSVACHLISTGFYDTFTKVNIKPKQIKQAEQFLVGQKIEKEHKKEIERNLMERKKIHLKNFIREISRHKINYKSKLWTYSLCKQGLREGFFPRFYYRTTRNCWSWLSKNLRSMLDEKIQDNKIVVRTLKALRKVEQRGVVGFYFNNSGHKKERICYGK